MFGALESDLDRFHQKDIRGLLTKPRKFTFRQVCVWIRHLPEESALHRRHIAGEVKPSDRDRMAAATINELRLSNYYTVKINSDEKATKDIPEPDLINLPE